MGGDEETRTWGCAKRLLEKNTRIKNRGKKPEKGHKIRRKLGRRTPVDYPEENILQEK